MVNDRIQEGHKRMEMNEGATIEFLILANHVEAINGLLYISGGGWTDQNRGAAPDQGTPLTHFGIGVSVLVPWGQTNQGHTLSIAIKDVDGAAVLQGPPVPINVGRPANLPPESDQRVVMALDIDFAFPRQGTYRIAARLDDRHEKTWTFRIHDLPGPLATAPQP
jgi:hypothetical protein